MSFPQLNQPFPSRLRIPNQTVDEFVKSQLRPFDIEYNQRNGQDEDVFFDAAQTAVGTSPALHPKWTAMQRVCDRSSPTSAPAPLRELQGEKMMDARVRFRYDLNCRSRVSVSLVLYAPSLTELVWLYCTVLLILSAPRLRSSRFHVLQLADLPAFTSIDQLKTYISRYLLQHHRGRHVLVRNTGPHMYTVFCTGGGRDERRKQRGSGAPLPERKCTFRINFCNPVLRRQSRLSAKEKKARASHAATAALSSSPLADDANESDDPDDADASHDVNASEEVKVRLSPR